MKDRRYIKVFSILWLLVMVLYALLLWSERIGLKLAIIDSVITLGTLYLFAIIVSNILKYYQPGPKNAGYIVFACAVLSFKWLAIVYFIIRIFQPEDASYEDFIHSSFWVKYSLGFLLLIISALVMWLRKLFENLNSEKEREIQTMQMAKDAELNTLRQQLQPHFLFNSLNSISALAGSNASKAREMIQQLSDFLRVTLKKDNHHFVSLSDEIEHLKLYLEIEKVRFGHRLEIVMRIDDACKAMQVPSLILQPVIENAIKFGLYNTLENVVISIDAQTADNLLSIKVSNPFDQKTNQTGNAGIGFGLNSMNRRLFLLYNRTDLIKTSTESKTFITTIIIPQQQ